MVWSQWRRWRDKGTWAAAMRVLAREIRLRNSRKADPTMVMVDGQTVKGGRAGPTFHEAGGSSSTCSSSKISRRLPSSAEAAYRPHMTTESTR